MARNRSAQWARAGLRLWAATGCRFSAAATPARAVWDHAVVHGWMGGVRTAHGCRAPRRWQATHAEHREQTYPSTDPDHAACTPHHMFVQNNDHARLGDRYLHQSL